MMIVKEHIAHRIVSLEKAANLKIGDVIPTPRERDDFECAESKRISEQVFEEMRKAKFSSLPSRESCLFVLPNDKEKVNLWIKSHNPHNNLDYALLTLQLSGELIWCDEDTFTKAGIPFFASKRESLAQDYWGSAKEYYSGFSMPEGLFVGIATIVDIEHKHHKGI